MYKYLAYFSLIFTIGCATPPKQPLVLSPEEKRIASDFNTTNTIIYAKYARKNKKDLSKFTETSYLKLLKEGKSDPERNVADMMSLFTTREFIPYGKTFVLCAFSPRLKIAFCDDAACEPVEFFERSDSAEMLTTWKKELPLKACASNAK
ncbi:hypothetical protein [Bdellovibrio bacteriovorus]|uniref:hypothetical protein n=1 Tax=Bdellovibrio bacteriovorus TaxID=959 RepID=UPI003AA86B81